MALSAPQMIVGAQVAHGVKIDQRTGRETPLPAVRYGIIARVLSDESPMRLFVKFGPTGVPEEVPPAELNFVANANKRTLGIVMPGPTDAGGEFATVANPAVVVQQTIEDKFHLTKPNVKGAVAR